MYGDDFINIFINQVVSIDLREWSWIQIGTAIVVITGALVNIIYMIKFFNQKADIKYVDKQVKMAKEDCENKIKEHEKVNDQTLQIVKEIQKRVNFIYEKHYKP